MNTTKTLEQLKAEAAAAAEAVAAAEPDMTQYRFFRHTPKAVRANSAFTVAPGDRVFIGVRTYKDGRELTKLIRDAKRGGSEPTAFFKPDSFYRELTAAEVFTS